MYKRYEENGIKVVKPINNRIIKVKKGNYNVFEYIDNCNNKRITEELLFNIIKTDRRYDGNNTLIDKCNNYYNNLIRIKPESTNLYKEIIYVTDKYKKIINNDIFNEKYINHGDLSIDNILQGKDDNYIIDFDEASIAPFLYDFAVIVIKQFVEKDDIKRIEFERLKKLISKEYKHYEERVFYMITEFYLIKILMEKFYFHLNGEINLYSQKQRKDSYMKYMELLKNLSNKGE